MIPEEHAFLTENEVIAVRLYTGPAYQPINSFLREIAELKDADARREMAADPSKTFACTCKYICRAIRKLAAVATDEEVATPLYRAVRGELPSSFWEPDADRMVCAIETAFMSTSRNRQTPIDYMDVGEGSANVLWQLFPSAPINVHRYRERGTVFCRGADVSMLSQFRNEWEVLFPPCTMLVVKPSCTMLDGADGAPQPQQAGEEVGAHKRALGGGLTISLGGGGNPFSQTVPPPSPGACSTASFFTPPSSAASSPRRLPTAVDADDEALHAVLDADDSHQLPGAPGKLLLPPQALAPSASALAAISARETRSERAKHCHENGRHFISITAQPCFI